MYTVYVHTVIENGKKYVGQCIGDPRRRWGATGHRYRGQFFYRAIEKYGWNNMTHEIVATNLSKEEADALEIELIKQYRSNQRKYGYNITPGGRDGAGSPGGKNHNAKAVVCIETGECWECASYCAKDLGVNVSSLQESLHNGYRCKGRHYKYVNDLTYTINPPPKKVLCVETGEIWESVKECAKAIGKDKKTIGHYCRKERRSRDGLTYEYVA